jgi:hypothetical protein
LQWADQGLTWNPNDYGGINKTNLPITKIWTPGEILIKEYLEQGFGIEMNGTEYNSE